MASKLTVRQRNGIWQIEFAFRDQRGIRRRFRRSIGKSADQAEAEAIGKRWKRQADAMGCVADFGDADQVFDNQEAERPFSGYAAQWMDNEQGKWKHSAIGAKESIIRVHLYPFFKHRDLRSILPADIERLITVKRKEGKKAKTVNNILAVLRSLLKSAFINGVVTRNVAAEVPMLKVQKPTNRFYDEQQTRAFLEMSRRRDPANYPLFQVAFTSGLRLGELAGLTWGQIDFVRGVIVVDRSVVRGRLCETKGYAVREVPLHPETLAVLKSYRQLRHLQGDLVFPWKQGKYFNENRVKWPFKRIRRLAGLPDIRFHDIRHSYASMLVMRGVSLYKVQNLLGHKDIKTTMRYAHLSPESLHGEVAKLFSDVQPSNGGVDSGARMDTEMDTLGKTAVSVG